MTTILLVIHLLLAISLVAVILMQRSEGGALGIGGGASGMMGGRGKSNLLTRTTAVLATLFICTSLTLAILASEERKPRSVLDAVPIPAAPAQPGAPAQPAPPAGQPAAPLGR